MPVNISVSGRHTTVSNSLRQQAEDKIGRLDKYLPGMDRAEIHFWEVKNPRVENREYCEVTISGHGHHVRCKVSAPDGFTAVDLAVDKLERQLRKLKTKVQRRQQGRERTALDAALLPDTLVPDTLLPEDQDAEPVYKIVKSKLFDEAPLDPQEAALQMDLLNHDFFLFRNSENSRASVVYRRSDGDIGQIELE